MANVGIRKASRSRGGCRQSTVLYNARAEAMIDHSIRVPQFHRSFDHGGFSIMLVAITILVPLRLPCCGPDNFSMAAYPNIPDPRNTTKPTDLDWTQVLVSSCQE